MSANVALVEFSTQVVARLAPHCCLLTDLLHGSAKALNAHGYVNNDGILLIPLVTSK